MGSKSWREVKSRKIRKEKEGRRSQRNKMKSLDLQVKDVQPENRSEKRSVER